jgi:hypothetical protein
MAAGDVQPSPTIDFEVTGDDIAFLKLAAANVVDALENELHTRTGMSTSDIVRMRDELDALAR